MSRMPIFVHWKPHLHSSFRLSTCRANLVAVFLSLEGSWSPRRESISAKGQWHLEPPTILGHRTFFSNCVWINLLVLLKIHKVSLKENVCGSYSQVSRKHGAFSGKLIMKLQMTVSWARFNSIKCKETDNPWKGREHVGKSEPDFQGDPGAWVISPPSSLESSEKEASLFSELSCCQKEHGEDREKKKSWQGLLFHSLAAGNLLSHSLQCLMLLHFFWLFF